MSGEQMRFDPDGAAAAGEEGMEMARRAERVQAWKTLADTWLDLQPVGREIVADDLVAVIGLPDEGPGRNNVVGAWFSSKAREGRIRFTGRRVASGRVVRHGNEQRVWVVCGGAQKVVAAYVDKVREAGGRRDGRQVGHMAKQVQAMLDESVEEGVLIEALEKMVSKGIAAPWRLGEFVNDVLLERARRPQQDLLGELMRQNGGWPTGTRFVRAEQAGTYVQDPLGYDTAPYDVPWGRPKRDEVLAALKQKGNGGDRYRTESRAGDKPEGDGGVSR